MARSLYHAAAMAVLAQLDQTLGEIGMIQLAARVGEMETARIYTEALNDSPHEVQQFWLGECNCDGHMN